MARAAGVVTVLAMLWVAWLGRERREVDRDVAVARMGEALTREHPGRSAPAPARERDRSTGIAVRRTRRETAYPPIPGHDRPRHARAAPQRLAVDERLRAAERPRDLMSQRRLAGPRRAAPARLWVAALWLPLPYVTYSPPDRRRAG